AEAVRAVPARGGRVVGARRRRDAAVRPARAARRGMTLWVGWVGGTAAGALIGGTIADPSAFGLDGAFAALFLALVVGQLQERRRIAAAIGGAVVAAALIPLTPPGVPIIAATAAVLVGWKR